MRAVVYDLGTGRIVLEVEGGSAQVEAQAVEGRLGVLEGEGATATHYVEDGRILPRAAPPFPASAEVRVGVPWNAGDLPADSLIVVDGEDAGAIDGAGLSMRFDVAGSYIVTVRAPFPWLEAKCVVSVVP